jgi:hypothetical protein
MTNARRVCVSERCLTLSVRWPATERARGLDTYGFKRSRSSANESRPLK